MIRHLLSQAVERCGYEITRSSKTPGPTLAGIAGLPIETILDVGANRGQFARQVLRLFPRANVYCFEPLPDALAHLRSWADAESLSNVTTLQLALGSANETAEMFVHVDHDASSSLLSTTERTRTLYAQTARQSRTTVQVRTLDALVDEGAVRLSAGTLLKIDVQGYELEVLRGARQSLRRIEASIVEVGLQPLYDTQGSFFAVAELLNEAGLRYAGNAAQVCDSLGRVVYVDAAFVRIAF